MKENLLIDKMLPVFDKTKQILESIGLFGLAEIMDDAYNGGNYEKIVDEMQRWLELHSATEMEEAGIPQEGKKMAQLFNLAIPVHDIHNIECGQEYDVKSNGMIYTIILNSQIPESARTKLVDYTLAVFQDKKERDRQYRYLKDKVRLLSGLKIL